MGNVGVANMKSGEYHFFSVYFGVSFSSLRKVS